MTEPTRPTRKLADPPRLVDATLDGTLDRWPEQPPRAPRTPIDKTRMALIDTPGQVHRLSPKFSDVGRAAKLAANFKRAKPSKLSPTATGTFDARPFFDPDTRQWRIAARYLPPPAPTPPPTPRDRHRPRQPKCPSAGPVPSPPAAPTSPPSPPPYGPSKPPTDAPPPSTKPAP